MVINYTNPQKQFIERHRKSKFSGFLFLLLLVAIISGTIGGLGYNVFVRPLPEWGLNFTSAGVSTMFFLFLLSMLISGGGFIVSFIMMVVDSDDEKLQSGDDGLKAFKYFISRLGNQGIIKYLFYLLLLALLSAMVANGYIWTTGFMIFFWASAFIMSFMDKGLRNHYISDLSQEKIERLEEALARAKQDEAMGEGLSELEKRTRKEAKDKMRREGCKQEAIDAYEKRIKKIGETVDKKTTI